MHPIIENRKKIISPLYETKKIPISPDAIKENPVRLDKAVEAHMQDHPELYAPGAKPHNAVLHKQHGLLVLYPHLFPNGVNNNAAINRAIKLINAARGKSKP